MLNKLIDFKSKTFYGILLGALGIVLSATDFIELPELAVRLVQIVGFLITTMGIRDAMLESQASLIQKIVDFKSKTFWGVIIEAVVHLTDNPDQFAIPEELKIVLRILGALAVAMGLRDAAKR